MLPRTNFRCFMHSMSLAVFSRVMGNWSENTCIFHVMKFNIKWESSGKTASIRREKYEYQFLRFSPYDGFCCIFLYYGKLMGKPMHFPYAELSHRMGIEWEESSHAMGNVWLSIFKTFRIPWILLHFPVLWEIDGKFMCFPYDDIG